MDIILIQKKIFGGKWKLTFFVEEKGLSFLEESGPAHIG